MSTPSPDKPGFPLPLIHLNGNSRESLLTGYTEALRAARDAEEAFRQIDFHPRNYYPLAEGSYVLAADQKQRAQTKLHDVIAYLEAHVHHLLADT
jgi:hypothetical protein